MEILSGNEESVLGRDCYLLRILSDLALHDDILFQNIYIMAQYTNNSLPNHTYSNFDHTYSSSDHYSSNELLDVCISEI
ncbi:hypothetical protein Agabi119p4_8549 [Agaricus bisporus var. burnettii]|uniref:Uncharacterized protein n=1 Tax=Agaricus bisporus var. burnettii TaxID=192524 RepID=A0A8H7C6Z5_AGABI|nr:hypothetical protein Agabi119p4_8549 [Agaricus bisporus var. burnettii]